MYQYILCGLKVESDLHLPELTPWRGPADYPCDVEFRLGPVEQLWPADEEGVKFQVAGPDKVIFSIEKVGRIQIENGTRVVFDAIAGLNEDRIRIELIGTTQAVLWYQRGYLPLHASALLADDRAIAIGARSHSGKSVLAAALTTRGLPLIADDMMVVDWSREMPRVLPGYQKLRLWEDACEQLGLQDDAIARALPAQDKFVLATAAAPVETPVPLTDIFILSGLRQTSFSVQSLGPVEGLQYLLAATHWMDVARALGRQQQVFDALNAVLTNVRIWRATAPQGLEHSLATADSILALARS